MVWLHGWTGYVVMGLVADKLLRVLRELGGWDLSTATFNGSPVNSYYVGTEDSFPSGVFFKDDGSKMYVTGRSGATVEEYTLTTNWDVSTASLSYTLDVSGQDSYPNGLFFKDDGSKMYVVGLFNATVYQYGLSTDWDLSSATYDNVSKDVSAQDDNLTGLFFRSNGEKMYITGLENDSVYEYTLSPAWSITSASLANTYSVSSQETSPNGLFFKDDGSKMYVIGYGNAKVYQYGLSTDWALSSATYDNVSKSTVTEDDAPVDIAFGSSGSKMYIIGLENDSVYEYTLSPAWSITSASLANTHSISSQEPVPQGLFFSSTGDKMYVTGTNAYVYEYDLGTNWSLASVTYNSVSKDVSAQESIPTGLFFRSNGEEMYVVGGSTDRVYKYTIPTVNAWDVSSASYTNPTTNYFSVSAKASSPEGLFFKPDGLKMYVIGSTSDSVHEYTLSSAWDVTSASFTASKSVSGQDGDPKGVFFKPDGSKMYIVGNATDTIYEYTLGTNWDVSSANYAPNNISISVGTADNAPAGLFFKNDGSKMYVVGNQNNKVYEYALSPAWDITSATSPSQDFVITEDTAPTDIFFGASGTKMYIVGAQNDSVYEYDLSVAWDIGYATYSTSKSVIQQENLPAGLFFKSNGTKMYITGGASDAVWSYDLE